MIKKANMTSIYFDLIVDLLMDTIVIAPGDGKQ